MQAHKEIILFEILVGQKPYALQCWKGQKNKEYISEIVIFFDDFPLYQITP
jgi:hypothetical protein